MCNNDYITTRKTPKKEEGIELKLNYAAGMMSVNFMLSAELVNVLIDNGFDSLKLHDSATGASLTLEVADLCIEQLVLLDEESDIDVI